VPVYDPKEHQTEVGKIVESFIKSIPGSKYILPDPYEPTSYINPIVAITRGQLMNKLGELLEGSYPSKVKSTLAVGQKIPRKLLKEIDEFGSFSELPKSKAKQVEAREGAYRGATWSKRKPNKVMETQKTTVGLNPRLFAPSTSAHEFAHELYYMLPEGEQKFLSKTFQNMSNDNLNNLIGKTRTSIFNSSELFSEAFAQYLLEGDRSNFKEFPPFVKHLVKKYYRLMK